ncbi:hypothetical protein IscW_ISCW012707 [Ixodes scapularis]|uniref:RNase H type-1 domain-containing protein n=1 Tax=Ixodes scapularis TaxID=6945 RepID=B7QF02_IXOSC|nr:hypothetical protein IscW_ISCW012707 [Ixodes scapularis]|eukprot:XP_002414116.1 hypothetical protein IscW_ISCW012707 [Ixodes scapularis]
MVKARRASEFERLSLTEVGRGMLRRLGYRVEGESRSERKVPPNLRDKIKVVPTPRHKHPEYRGERWKVRLEVFLRMCEGRWKTPRGTPTRRSTLGEEVYALSVVDGSGRELAVASTETWITDSAEEAAIALAATTGRGGITIITDWQAACRNYQRESVAATALKILGKIKDLPENQIVLAPGPEDLAGNKAVHAAVRAHSFRTSLSVDRAMLSPDGGVL